MPKLYFDNQIIELSGDDSVLTTLLKEGHSIPYSCQSGVCHSCLMQVDKGQIPPRAQAGLSAPEKDQDLILSCCCQPDTDLWLSRYNLDQVRLPARVTAKKMLSRSVLALEVEADVRFHAGQYFTLWRNDTIARSYSTASVDDGSGRLVFHIKVLPDGAFSAWAADALLPGQTLQLQGPFGDCYFQPETGQEPLLLAGLGTGIAPLYGIIGDALRLQHRGEIHFIAAARDSQNLYARSMLQALAAHAPGIKLHLLAQALSVPTHPIIEADIYTYLRDNFSGLNQHQIYLAGSASFVQKIRKQCFMAGARPRAVFADSFVAS